MSRSLRLPVRGACVEVVCGQDEAKGRPWKGRVFDRVPHQTGMPPIFWVEFVTGEIAPLFRQDFRVVACAPGFPRVHSRLPVGTSKLKHGRVTPFRRRTPGVVT